LLVANIRDRLTECFAAVFPDLPIQDIPNADHYNLAGWDSVASVTLFATIEEEFGLELDLDDLPGLVSFDKILAYLSTKVTALP
jgi:acyl carrier protein